MRNFYFIFHAFKINIIALILYLLAFFSTRADAQWIQISTISTPRLNTVKFLDVNTGVTGGYGGIWRTTNGGYNWVSVLSSSKLNSVSFFDADNGMAVGDSGKIYKTTDKGITWQQLNSGTSANLNSVSFSPPGDLSVSGASNTHTTAFFAYVVGQNGILLRSYNSGATWTIGSAFTQDLYFIIILPNFFGFALGAANCELYTTTANGGSYWQPILNTTNGGYHLYSGAFLTGQNTCLAVGSGGRIRRTTNWGLSWVLPVSNTTYDLYSVTFADASTGWLCGQNGFIERSTNGGLNWTQQFASIYNHLRSISFINNLTGWIVGDNGVVLRTNNGGITGIQNTNSEIPTEFKLYQNYPNPFNPITIIKFDLRKSGVVKVRIYDIKGCLVAVLVNEYQNPGEHYVKFNGSNFSSGIYIYRFESGKYVSVKIMTLIK